MALRFTRIDMVFKSTIIDKYMELPVRNNPLQKFTYKDYLAWPDDERWEIINGVADNMSPAPSTEHQRISMALLNAFYNYLKGTSFEVFHAPFDVRLPEHEEDDEDIVTVVQPDIVVVCDKSKIDQQGCRGASDLIVEIVSPYTAGKDMKEKFQLYEHHGVKEYWIVFPWEKTVMVFTLSRAGDYGKPETYVRSDTLIAGLLTGLEIDLSEVFTE